MNLSNKELQDILIAGNYINLNDVALLQEYVDQKENVLMNFLVTQGILTKDIIGQAIAEHYKVPYADLNSYMPTKEMVLRLPESFAKKNRAVVFEQNGSDVIITTSNPLKKGLAASAKKSLAPLSEVKKKISPKKVSIYYSLPEDIEEAFIAYRKPLQDRLKSIVSSGDKMAPRIFDEVMQDALALRCSDIHFDPREELIVIRFRIDGILRDVAKLEPRIYGNVLNHIKVRSSLRTDLHAATQDGSMRYEHNERKTDLRISIAPLMDGEKIVLRLLAAYVRGFTFTDLGLNQAHQNALLASARKPFGMILVVGPTGSGKTTSLYGLIKTLNKTTVNIATIEDPVEYKVAGVNHMQVNKETNLSFATGLRSIVRQDPDVILVGEIRDQETADIATNAALTGHLMLSTFHANDAATAIPRLMDMGVEPFILASTLELIIAQRLVRKICERCRETSKTSRAEIIKNNPSLSRSMKKGRLVHYIGKGCSSCAGTGYSGRTALFEFILVDDNLKEIVAKRPTAQDIRAYADKNLSPTLYMDGLAKVYAGVTTINEVVRVALQ